MAKHNGVPYHSHRDERFEHSTDAIDAIIGWNCHGCTVPDAASIADMGPGGDCHLLLAVAIGDYDTPILALRDNGRTIRCTARHIDPPPPIPPPQAESLFEVPHG